MATKVSGVATIHRKPTDGVTLRANLLHHTDSNRFGVGYWQDNGSGSPVLTQSLYGDMAIIKAFTTHGAQYIYNIGGAPHNGIPIKPNTIYTYSIYVCGSIDMSSAITIHVRKEGDNAGSTVNGHYTEVSKDVSVVSNIWKRCFITFKTEDTESQLFFTPFVYTYGVASNKDILFCQPKLEEGSAPSPWCISEQDKVGSQGDTGAAAVLYSITADKTVMTEGIDDTNNLYISKTVGDSTRILSFNETVIDGITLAEHSWLKWDNDGQQIHESTGVKYGTDYTVIAYKDSIEVARLTIPVVKNGTNGEPGNNGAYTVYDFGISAFLNAPNDVTIWNGTPVQATTEKPYLWMRMIRYDGNDNQIGHPTYARLTGEKGAAGTSLTIVDTFAKHFATVEDMRNYSNLVVGEKYAYDWDDNDDGCCYLCTYLGSGRFSEDYAEDKSYYSCTDDGHLYYSYGSDRVWADMGSIRGTSVKAEYHAGEAYPQKNSTGWHSPYVEGDIWMHIDDGTGSGWGDAVRVKGEKGEASVMYQIDVISAYHTDEYNIHHNCRIYRVEGTNRTEITGRNYKLYGVYPHCKAEEEDMWYDSMSYDSADGWICTHGVSTWQKCIAVGLFGHDGDAYDTDTMYASVVTTLAKDGAKGRNGQTFTFWNWADVKNEYETLGTMHTFYDKDRKIGDAYVADVAIVDEENHIQYVCIKQYTYGIGANTKDPQDDPQHWSAISWMNNIATDILLSNKMYAKVLEAVNARIDELIVKHFKAVIGDSVVSTINENLNGEFIQYYNEDDPETGEHYSGKRFEINNGDIIYYNKNGTIKWRLGESGAIDNSVAEYYSTVQLTYLGTSYNESSLKTTDSLPMDSTGRNRGGYKQFHSEQYLHVDLDGVYVYGNVPPYSVPTGGFIVPDGYYTYTGIPMAQTSIKDTHRSEIMYRRTVLHIVNGASNLEDTHFVEWTEVDGVIIN